MNCDFLVLFIHRCNFYVICKLQPYLLCQYLKFCILPNLLHNLFRIAALVFQRRYIIIEFTSFFSFACISCINVPFRILYSSSTIFPVVLSANQPQPAGQWFPPSFPSGPTMSNIPRCFSSFFSPSFCCPKQAF